MGTFDEGTCEAERLPIIYIAFIIDAVTYDRKWLKSYPVYRNQYQPFHYWSTVFDTTSRACVPQENS